VKCIEPWRKVYSFKVQRYIHLDTKVHSFRHPLTIPLDTLLPFQGLRDTGRMCTCARNDGRSFLVLGPGKDTRTL